LNIKLENDQFFSSGGPSPRAPSLSAPPHTN
jgi:hypothetical protein